MNYRICFFLVFVLPALRLSAQQDTAKAEFYSADFDWTISIPPDFKQIDNDAWDRLKAPSGTTGNDTITNRTHTVAVFAANQFNYFESNWQPYNPKERGDFGEHCQAVAQELTRNFTEQLPEAKIDTASGIQQIGAMQFRRFTLKMSLPNGAVLYSYMYSRLFGEMEFSANLFYVKPDLGAMMLEAWLNSRFE